MDLLECNTHASAGEISINKPNSLSLSSLCYVHVTFSRKLLFLHYPACYNYVRMHTVLILMHEASVQ